MMTETQRAAMQAAHNALKTAQNAITFDDDGLWGQYQVALNSITAALAEPGPAGSLHVPELRDPLTDEQVDYIYNEHRGDGGPTAICEQFARAIEAAHGIGAKP